jgi:Gram-negative bacterial TonB protein C-terminal
MNLVTKIVICLMLSVFAIGLDAEAFQTESPIPDREIRVLAFEELSYPVAARTAHIQGLVVVRVTLDDHGNVVAASALSGSEPLVTNCLGNIRKWRFAPNRLRSAIIVYNFRLVEGVLKPAESTFHFLGPNFVTISATLPKAEP